MSDDGFNATVDCPDFDESGNQLLGNLGYWMEGIAQCSIAVLGIMFNIGSSLVLASRWVWEWERVFYHHQGWLVWIGFTGMESVPGFSFHGPLHLNMSLHCTVRGRGWGVMISALWRRVVKMPGRNFYEAMPRYSAIMRRWQQRRKIWSGSDAEIFKHLNSRERSKIWVTTDGLISLSVFFAEEIQCPK